MNRAGPSSKLWHRALPSTPRHCCSHLHRTAPIRAATVRESDCACGPPKLMKTHVGQVGRFEAIARAP